MKTILFILALSCQMVYSFGQASIKGRVKDRQHDLPLAAVLFLGPDSSLVKGVVTDNEGRFIFENVLPGNYLIASSMVGYTRFISQEISVAEKDIVLPDIILEESATELSEVVVNAEKPLFEQQIDRLVVNVQSSITLSGNTILEVLQKSPGVMVNRQNNSISMSGKVGVRVMINDKLMQLQPDVVVQMLDGMNASNVERIELITTPSARYDAEGSAGIIHIVTKENTDLGTSCLFTLIAGAHWAETLGGSFNLSHRSKKFAAFLDYSVVRNHNLHRSQIDRKSLANGFVQTVYDESSRENVTNQQNLNVGVEWKIDNSTTLSLLVAGYRRNWDLHATAHDANQAAADSTVITDLKIHESNIWQSATGALGLQTKINSKSEINVNLDYLYYHNNNPSEYDNKLFYEQHKINEASQIDLQKKTPIRILIAGADYQYEASPSLTVEAGVKAVTSHLDNNVQVHRLINDVWTVDPFFTSYSTLREQTGAAYASTKWKAGPQWQVNSGLRYEYTHTTIGTPTMKNLVNRKYGYFFPAISIKKELASEKDFQFSYSRRITRPTYNDIAPYVFFWGPSTFSSGNTSLWPAISDALKIGYHVKQWIISLQYNHSRKEIIAYQPENDSQSQNLIYRSQNLRYANTIGLTNSYSFTVAAWWEVQSNLTATYQTARTSHLPENAGFHLYGLNVNVNVTNVFQLPKNFALEISGFYQSRLLAGIAEYLPQGSLNAGIQKKMGEKGTWQLAMDDILDTNYWRIKTNMPQNNLDTSFNYNFHNQFIRLSYSRTLGNNRLRTIKLKSGSEEERGRVN
jgi:hypothetical protein